MNDQYLLAVFIAGTVLITIFAVMMTVFLVINKQKQNRDKLERQQLEHTYHSNLMRTRIDMQEQALHYVSQEIHDNMGQVLSFSCLQLANLKWAIPNETARASLTENLDVIRNAVKELRMLSHSLNTNRVEKRHLEEIIESELNRIRSFSPIKCYLEVKGHVSSLSPETRLLIFRILQEALQNVVKHADAKSVNISIGYDERHFNMTVKDDGKGINMEALKDSGSLGMGNMEERAKLMGGTVTVHSDGHSGTEISLDIPIIKNIHTYAGNN